MENQNGKVSNKYTFKTFMEWAKIMSGPKRMLLLYMLAKEPMKYAQIDAEFKKNGIPAGSSEVYKHIHTLTKARLITKIEMGKMYAATLKGVGFIKSLNGVIETPDKSPKLKAMFD